MILRRLLFVLFAIPVFVLIIVFGALGFIFAPLAWLLTGDGENGWVLAGMLVDVWDRVAERLTEPRERRVVQKGARWP
jgi:hypothetical protein